MIIRFAVWSAADIWEAKIMGKTPIVLGRTMEEAKEKCIRLIGELLVKAKFSSHGLRDTNSMADYKPIPMRAVIFEIDSNAFVAVA